MRIIGFDIGSNLGWAVGRQGENGHQDLVHNWGSIALQGKNREQKLYDAMDNQLPALFRGYHVNAVIYEKPFVRGDAATRMLWGLAGVIEAVSTLHGFGVVDATATQVRKEIFGQGIGMSKADVIAKLADYPDIDEHSADAIALTLYGLKKLETL